ncbi:DUF4265 domain-containing protein [Teredinibacter purpureus]|uniref:DUF4265 domain-containing protein n=1 Tax=Teredinibacter purpureus TaxID=2731756 RepID=UPI0005F85F4C|nr:DUF4265 domain-containing protein [Teredinibacter purpureus]
MSNDLPVQDIALFAGAKPDGKPVIETLAAIEIEPNQFQLEKSPAFVRGIARGDVIAVEKERGTHTLIKRAGNLCIRVISKNDIALIADRLIPPFEKLGGVTDFRNERMVVLSIHVSCGFQAIEALLDQYVGEKSESGWMYGNVYHVENDELVPLNWWQELLKPE